MRCPRPVILSTLSSVVFGGLILGLAVGCGGSSLLRSIGTPFPLPAGVSNTPTPASSGRSAGGTSGASSRSDSDPCDETQNRKIIFLSMRNLTDDYIHYYLLLIAFIDDPTTDDVEGAVCEDDIPLYTSFGYQLVPEGTSIPFGNVCIPGNSLYYFHENGQFQGAGQGLASAIAPAAGSTATYDTYFNQSGRQVPVPDRIIFHNPGTSAEARALKVAESSVNPCAVVINDVGDPECEQDGWYYVDEFDFPAGSRPTGSDGVEAGIYVRYPADIQGTGCACNLGNIPYSQLAPSNAAASDALCNEFLRGGRIDYVFVRDDTEPPFPQLVWRVTDSNGTRAHDFDPRANVQ